MKLRSLKERINGRLLVPEASAGMNLNEFQNYIYNADKKTKVKGSVGNIAGEETMMCFAYNTLGKLLEGLDKHGYFRNGDFSAKHELYRGAKDKKHYFDITHIKKIKSRESVLEREKKASFSYVLGNQNNQENRKSF